MMPSLHGLIFLISISNHILISSMESFICANPQKGQYIPVLCNTSCGALAGMGEKSSMRPSQDGSNILYFKVSAT